MASAELQRTLEAIWRIESPKVIASATRILRDVGRAEDVAQDAFVAALVQWPESGIPRSPGAWLTTAAKRRAIDAVRRDVALARKAEELAAAGGARRVEPPADVDIDACDGDAIDDDLLRLMFVAAHPVLAAEARVALMLRLLGGLTTAEIARAFLVAEATVAQRIVRAKRALADARVPFEVPPAAERHVRVASVLEAIYLIFNEGYAATAGDDVVRPALVEDALRLGRVLAALMPDEAESHALVALMELQSSRMRARVGPGGEPILLLDQDRARWDRLAIGRGLAALARAGRLAGSVPGPYALQAELAACHARAATPEATDWPRIAALYGTLARLLPTPVVELNRAVAVGMAFGPQAGLDVVDGLRGEPSLRSYHLLPSVRGDLLAKLGREYEAAAEFERAAALAGNLRDRTLSLERAAAARARGGLAPRAETAGTSAVDLLN